MAVDRASPGAVGGSVIPKDHGGALVLWGLPDLLTLPQQTPPPLPFQGETWFSLAF